MLIYNKLIEVQQPMKKNGYWYLFLFILLFSKSSLFANKNGLFNKGKYKSSAIVLTGVGPSFCFGDIGGSESDQILFGINDWVIKSTSYNVSVGLRNEFYNNFRYKITGFIGKFEGSDEGSRNSLRGYSYKSKVYELSSTVEYALSPLFFNFENPHIFYAFGGLGVVHSRAEVKSANNTFRPSDQLQPITTSLILPVGVGYEYTINRNFSAGAEFGWRLANTDFIDGIIPMNSKRNDMYTTLLFAITYRFRHNRYNYCNCDW